MNNLLKALSATVLTLILVSTVGCVPSESMGASGQRTDNITENFLNPPSEARAYTWWHWMNGNVNRQGITADLEAMAGAGIGGAWIFNIAGSHSCNIPAGPVDYMSDEWLELVKFAAEEADRLGLKLGFHNCAGWATMGGPWIEPKDGMQHLVSTVVKVDGGKRYDIKLEHPETKLGFYRDIAVLAFPTPKDEKFRVRAWQSKSAQRGAPSGRQPDLRECPEDAAIKLGSIIDVTRHFSKKDGRLLWDVPEGNWTILRIGHTPSGKINHPSAESGVGLEVDKLKRDGVDVHWQKGIKPVLDRVGPLAGKTFNNILIDSYEAGLNHWTPRMRKEFKRRCGYNITPYLLALTGRLVEDGPTTERFYWDFRMTVSELFTKNFYGYFGDLCHKNGLEFSTEPYTSAFEGLAVAGKADIPMGEFWATGGYSYTLKLASSIAHINGRKFAGAESFTASPEVGKWQNHPGKLKKVGDFAWAQGINRLILHAFAHQPLGDAVPGMTFGQWGCHFDRNVTWFKPGKAWFDYIGRSQFLLQYGEFGADVLVFAGEAAPNGAVHIKGLKEAGYDYDCCGTDIFAKLTVDEGEIVLPTGKRYKLLVMPGKAFQSPHIIRKVRGLVAAGAKVLSPKPKHSPTLSRFPNSEKEVLTIADEVWGNCDGKAATMNDYKDGKVFAGLSAIETLKHLGIRPAVKLPPETAWLHRTAPGVDIFYISNQSDKEINAIGEFRTAGGKGELFDAERGTITDIYGRPNDSHTQIPISLGAEKSIFVVFRNQDKSTTNEIPPGIYTGSQKTINLSGPWDVSFQSDRGAPANTRFDKLISWPKHKNAGIRYFSGTATYTTSFDLRKSDLKNKQVLLDLGKVEVVAEVSVNGKDLGTLWHKPFRIDIADELQAGTNTLEVKVTNLWINRLIGDEQHPDDCKWNSEKWKKFDNKALAEWPEWFVKGKQRPVPQRITFTTWKHWNADDPLKPSGLIGPVTLQSATIKD